MLGYPGPVLVAAAALTPSFDLDILGRERTSRRVATQATAALALVYELIEFSMPSTYHAGLAEGLHVVHPASLQR
jgi:hypothetical protein